MEFIVYKPVWQHHSAGVRALYILEDKLKELGHVVNSRSKNAIVIYPEKVNGNPLDAKNVVRWMLNTPKYWGRDYEYGEDDMIVAFKSYLIKEMGREVHAVMSVNTIEPWLFYNDGKEKTESVLFIGKCHKKEVKLQSEKEKDRLITITKSFPATREETARLLRKTKHLYSLDDRSAVVDEALMCGARAWVGTQEMKKSDLPHINDFNDNTEIIRFVEKCREYFNG